MADEGGEITIVRARYVAPMHRAMIADGAVAIRRGRVMSVGPWSHVRQSVSAQAVEDLGEQILLPGLVNAHTHLELSDLSRPAEMAGFVSWLLKVMSTPSDPVAAMSIGYEACLRFGITTVGDITRQPKITRPLLRTGKLRAISFGEVTAMAGRRGMFDDRLAAAIEGPDSERVRIGVSPHAPYSIEPAGYARCLAVAMSLRMPITTHLAESPDEAEFLAHHTGPFRKLWETIGGWDDAVPRFAGGPIRFAERLGLIAHPTLLAHVNYCDDAELEILAGGEASVVYCPRTHDYFQHPPHRWREMLAAGINVAVGTDSSASSGDLNLVDDLRLLHRIAPEVLPETLFEMATVRTARALGDQTVGSLDVGKRAVMVAFAAGGADPLREILESRVLPTRVWAPDRVEPT